jgi:hypothetical protein
MRDEGGIGSAVCGSEEFRYPLELLAVAVSIRS